MPTQSADRSEARSGWRTSSSRVGQKLNQPECLFSRIRASQIYDRHVTAKACGSKESNPLSRFPRESRGGRVPPTPQKQRLPRKRASPPCASPSASVLVLLRIIELEQSNNWEQAQPLNGWPPRQWMAATSALDFYDLLIEARYWPSERWAKVEF